VKSTYRAFAQDEVFEIVERHDPSNPLSIGLEPWLTHVRTFPGDDEPALNILIDLPTNKIFPHGFKYGGFETMENAASSFKRLFPSHTDRKAEWDSFLKSAPKSDFVSDYIDNGGVLYVPMKHILFGLCNVDKTVNVPPLVSNKRTFNGDPIKERRTTSNVPHRDCKERKKPRVALNPNEEPPQDDLNGEVVLADLANNVAKLDVKKITKKQLSQLLVNKSLKTTGNKVQMLDRLQKYYATALL